MYKDILRYMGHKGETNTQLNNLIFSCLEKITAVSTPRYVTQKLICAVENQSVKIDTLTINSSALASHLSGSAQAYLFAATLGAEVDRTISQRSVVDSAEAFCLQACAAAKIEEYCDQIEKELAHNAQEQGLNITPRFSPGYGDFDISHQSDILRLLNAQKKIGVTVTKTHMLSPLKSVTAIIGVNSCNSWTKKINKCDNCTKTGCQFRITKGNCRD